jgi:prephenate dehydrogenase
VLPFRTATIVGVGLVGGSLGMAMRQRQLARRVVGVGHRQSSLDRALGLGAIDEATLDIREGVAEAELVVLATPVGLMADLVRKAAGSIPRGCILTDVGSTKAELVRAIGDLANETFRYIGAHPIAGSERRGVDHARADLFDGRLCFLTPTARSDEMALGAVTELWRGAGARVRVIDPVEHDRLVASASHLPHLVAAALVNVMPADAMACVGAGFLDTTRIASGDPRMWADVCSHNRSRIAEALRRFGREIDVIRDIVDRQAETELLAWLESAKAGRDQHAEA